MAKINASAEWRRLDNSTSDNIRQQVELLIGFLKANSAKLPLREVALRGGGDITIKMGVVGTRAKVYWRFDEELLYETYFVRDDQTPVVQRLDDRGLEQVASSGLARDFLKNLCRFE